MRRSQHPDGSRSSGTAREQTPILDIRGKGLHMITAGGDSGALETARQGLSLLARHYADHVQIRDLRTRR